DRFDNRFQCRFVGRQVRGETTFVADGGVQAALFQYALQRVENFRAATDCLGSGRGTHRLDHEFLDIDVVVGVLAAVDDVHHRHRQAVGAVVVLQVGNIFVQRLLLVGRGGLGQRQ